MISLLIGLALLVFVAYIGRTIMRLLNIDEELPEKIFQVFTFIVFSPLLITIIVFNKLGVDQESKLGWIPLVLGLGLQCGIPLLILQLLRQGR